MTAQEERPRLARAFARGLAIALIAPGILVASSDEARADSTSVMGATLPWGTGRSGTSAVWDGVNAYIFGGTYGSSYANKIVRYNPATDTATKMSATLPAGLSDTAAVWDGANAYIFGGSEGWTYSDRILRYNPATDTLTVLSSTLPSSRFGSSAIWDGANAYVFGGQDGNTNYLRDIVRFNPATGIVTTLSATLPTGLYSASAAWDGTHAYIFGGHGNLKKIVRFTPATSAVAVMSATLPAQGVDTSAVWIGTSAFIFGGWDGFAGNVDHIVRYTPSTNSVTIMGGTLPSPRSATSAIWDGTNAYIFGGWDAGDFSEIVQYNLAPGAPRDLSASSGPDRGEITLNWRAPSNNGGFPVTNYNVYRSTTSGGPYTRIAILGNVLTYKDTGLPDGVTRYYRVSAQGPGGEGPESNEASGTTFGVPGAPRALQVTPGPGTGEITLMWETPNENGDEVSFYRIYRRTTSEPETLVATVNDEPPPFTQRHQWTDDDLAPSTTYYYRVSAVIGVVESAKSNEASASTFLLYAAVPDADCTSQSRPHVQVCWRGDPDAQWIGASTCDSSRRTRVEALESGIDSPEAGIASCLVFQDLLGPVTDGADQR